MASTRARSISLRSIHRPTRYVIVRTAGLLGPCACCRENCRQPGCRCCLHYNTPDYSEQGASFALTGRHLTPATLSIPGSPNSYASSTRTSHDSEDTSPPAEYHNHHFEFATQGSALQDAPLFRQSPFGDSVDGRVRADYYNDANAQDSDSDRESPPHMYASVILERPQQAGSGRSSTQDRHRIPNTTRSNAHSRRTHSATMSDDLRHVGGSLDAFTGHENLQYPTSFLRIPG